MATAGKRPRIVQGPEQRSVQAAECFQPEKPGAQPVEMDDVGIDRGDFRLQVVGPDGRREVVDRRLRVPPHRQCAEGHLQPAGQAAQSPGRAEGGGGFSGCVMDEKTRVEAEIPHAMEQAGGRPGGTADFIERIEHQDFHRVQKPFSSLAKVFSSQLRTR
ncbi:MAG: hypothetical protein P8Y96_12470 [Desulfuromonadales bacterium]